MPAPGEQHKASAASANPFEDVKLHINEYTAQEVATLQSRLEKQLGPEYISSRPGAGGQKVHYLAAEKCINLANEVFGFNGWSSGIRDVTVDFIDESQSTGKITLGLSVIVRVTLRDGTYHEDIGYGHIENCKGKAAAFEKAKKEGTTDALKRALRNFGNILGNCIYDKDYLARVTKLKTAPSKWDSENLHRHVDYAPIKRESIVDADDLTGLRSESCSTVKEIDDEFGGADFDEVDFSVTTGGHPDEVVLESSIISTRFDRNASPTRNGSAANNQRASGLNLQQPGPQPARVQPMPSNNLIGPQTPMLAPPTNNQQTARQAVFAQTNQMAVPRPPYGVLQTANPSRPQGNPNYSAQPAASAAPNSNITFPRPQDQHGAVNNPQAATPPSRSLDSTDVEPVVGFFTARAAESLQNQKNLHPNVPQFNPHAESPSIRKTAGVDHTKTKPVGRDVIGAPASLVQSMPPVRTNFINPQADQARRIGMPGAAASPLQNRNSYRPPQMAHKRPAEVGVAQYGRPPLGDVTSASTNTPLDVGGGENKRMKLGPNGQSMSNVMNVVPG